MGRYRDIAWDIALGQHGYVRTSDATAAGIPAVELVKLAEHEGLERVGYGVYLFTAMPITRFASFFEAVARVGGDAHLVDESVLHFHQLADLNPPTIKVGSGHRVRRTLPPWVEVIAHRADALVDYEGVPSMPLVEALRRCRAHLIAERYAAAVAAAGDAGLITPSDVKLLTA